MQIMTRWQMVVDELKYVLTAGWQLLWSIPLAAAFVVLYGLLLIGFGVKRADKLILAWEQVVAHDTP